MMRLNGPLRKMKISSENVAICAGKASFWKAEVLWRCYPRNQTTVRFPQSWCQKIRININLSKHPDQGRFQSLSQRSTKTNQDSAICTLKWPNSCHRRSRKGTHPGIHSQAITKITKFHKFHTTWNFGKKKTICFHASGLLQKLHPQLTIAHGEEICEHYVTVQKHMTTLLKCWNPMFLGQERVKWCDLCPQKSASRPREGPKAWPTGHSFGPFPKVRPMVSPSRHV